MGTVTELDVRKATVRRFVLARRGRLSAQEREAAATSVAARVARLPDVAAAGTILGFASFGTELSTDPVMRWVFSSGKRLLVPYVEGAALRAAVIGSEEQLAPGYRGIREPVRRVPVDAEEADVVLVPGVAFDPAGRRLGYGGGFYDAFLAGIPGGVSRVGLCFDLQVVDEVPAGPNDEGVGLVVTELRDFPAQNA